MSPVQQFSDSRSPQNTPSLEPWIVVCLLAFVPAVLIVILPHAALRTALLPIIGSMVVLISAGLAMLWRGTRKRRSAEAHQRDQPHVGGARDS